MFFKNQCTAFCICTLLCLNATALWAQQSFSTEYFPVYSTTAAELVQEIQQKGPRGFAAYTESEFRYEFNTSLTDNRCRLSRMRLRMDVLYTLPRWESRSSADAALQARWDQWFTALEQHEQNHGDIARESYRELSREFSVINARNSCAEIESSITTAAASANTARAAAQSAYDQSTNHGATEGASYNILLGNSSSSEVSGVSASLFSGRLFWWLGAGLVLGLLLLRR